MSRRAGFLFRRRQRFIEFWGPRIGEHAAVLRAGAANLAYLMGLLSLPFILTGA